MADLLTHGLVAYGVSRLLSIRYGWLTSEYVTVAIVGSLLPDLVKIGRLVPDDRVSGALGRPFAWSGLHTLGGAAASALAGVALVPDDYRSRVGAALSLGALSHFALDAAHPDFGQLPGHYWPLSDRRHLLAGKYVSSDRWPLLVALCFAAAVRRLADTLGGR